MIITVDVGGTKTLVASFSKEGKKLDICKFPTPKTQEDFFKVLNSAINKLKSSDTKCISIAMPGLIDRKKGEVVSLGNLSWHDVPVRAELKKAHDLPILIDNDANLAGLAEAHELDKAKYPLVVYVTVSTGIGTGIIDRHKIHPDFADSEGGSMQFKHGEHTSDWEDFASGRAIKKTYGKLASEIDDDKTWKEISANLAPGFINIIALLQPQAIVIGGGVGTHYKKFEKHLDKLIKEAQKDSSVLRKHPPLIKQADNPEEAVIYGCYILAKQEGYAA